MNIRYFLKFLSLFLLTSPLVSATSECEKFQNSLGNINNSNIDCFSNDNGEINKLYIDNVDLTEEQVNQIFSYDLDDVTDLTYIVNVGTVEGEVAGQHLGYSKIPSSINKLSNLEYLNINYDSYLRGYAYVVNYTMEGTFKNLNNLKSLTLRGIHISQHDINEISELENLESLTFIYSFFGYGGLNYEHFGKLKKLTTLNIINDDYEYYCVEPNLFDSNRFTPNELINANKSVKELTIENLGDIIIDLPNLEKLYIKNKETFQSDIPNKLEKIVEFDLTYSPPKFYFDEEFKNITIDLSKLNDDLEKFSLTGCNISENDQQYIENFSHLKELTLKNCNLTKIPESVFSLSELKSIDLSDNLLNTFDGRLNNLENIESINVRNNVIEGELPDFLNYLPNLKEIDFSNNKLKGETLTNPNLEKCDYDNNSSLCLAEKMDCIKNEEMILCSEVPTPTTTLYEPTETGECGNFLKYVGRVSNNNYIECTMNDEGNISKLIVKNADITEDQINKLFSYDLDDLIDFTYVIDVGYSPGYTPNEHPGYSKIPTEIKDLKNLETLYIDYSSSTHPCSADCLDVALTTMEGDTIKNLKNLKYLTIKGVKISQENIDDISTLSNLESLIFTDSYLPEDLDYKSLSDLKKLSYLNISNNRDGYLIEDHDDDYEKVYKSVPSDLLNACKNIKELFIYLFSSEDISLDNFPNLEKLYISNDNSFNNNKFVFNSDLEKLTTLSLSFIDHGYFSYHQSYLDFDFTKMKNLQSLYLGSYIFDDENMKEITNLSKLTNIEFGGCILSNVTSDSLNGLNNLEELTSLEFRYCEINDEQFGELKRLEKLTSLNITGCDITKIPEFVYSLTNLKSIDLSENELIIFDEKLSNLKNLESINLSRNEIKGEIPVFFNYLINLKEVDFSNNQIEGKTLTNPTLEKCEYKNNPGLCKAVSMKCLENQNIEYCDGSEHQQITTSEAEPTPSIITDENEPTPTNTGINPTNTNDENEPTPTNTVINSINTNDDENEPTPTNTVINPINTNNNETEPNEVQSTTTITKVVTKPIVPTSTINEINNDDNDNNDNDGDSSNDSDSNDSDSDSEDKIIDEIDNKDDYSLNETNENDEDSDEDDKNTLIEKFKSSIYKFIELVKKLIDHLKKQQ